MSGRGHLLHAQQLMGIGRWEAAADKLRLALAESPEDAQAHALLALCWSRLERHREAREEADRAVAHAPDTPHAHWVRGVVLAADSRHAEAERSAREALRLDPDDPDHHHLVAACLLQRDEASAALTMVEQGLERDPEHAGLNDLRVTLLQRLGRAAEAEAAVADALRRDPDDAEHHANAGWSALRAHDPARAAQHFAEALRLEPGNEGARIGLVEALKARYLLYRLFLAWIFLLMRWPPTVRMTVIVGGWFLHSLAMRLSDLHPQWSPWLTPVVWGYFAFAFLTWTAAPLFDLLLLLHPLGRHALDRRERLAAAGGGALIAIALIGVASWPLTHHAIGLLAALFATMAVAVIHPALAERVPRRRRILLGAGLVWLAFAATALVLIGLEQRLGARLLGYAFYGWIALTFLPGLVARSGR